MTVCDSKFLVYAAFKKRVYSPDIKTTTSTIWTHHRLNLEAVCGEDEGATAAVDRNGSHSWEKEAEIVRRFWKCCKGC